MASRRMLPDTVKIFNYTGEKNRVAQYQETTIEHCYCPITFGAPVGTRLGGAGKIPDGEGQLFIFDFASKATGPDGAGRSYMPYMDWKNLPEEERTKYWTLNTGGKDYFAKEGYEAAHFKIGHFTHLVAGTKRMWHFEVKGK